MTTAERRNLSESKSLSRLLLRRRRRKNATMRPITAMAPIVPPTIPITAPVPNPEAGPGAVEVVEGATD
jgi:hypothetical protein